MPRVRSGGRSGLLFSILLLSGLLSVGCAGSSARSWDSSVQSAPVATGGYAQRGAPPPAEYEMMTGEPAAEMAEEAGDWDQRAPEPSPPPQHAQNTTTPASPTTSPTATDAVDLSRPILIYQASLQMAVHHVETRQDAVVALVNEAGGYLSKRNDSMLVVRVPAARFEELLEAIEGEGDLLSRNVEVLDVGEQYRDLRIRIQNLEAMRVRLVALLERAEAIEDALRVERELNRVTLELERARGQIRHLSQRIAFSTITIHYRALTDQQVPSFQLPFDWLQRLGIRHLLSL